MLPLRRHRRLAAWLTLCALVLATVAPGVARALALANGDAGSWGKVCSVSAGQRADNSSLPAGEAAHLLDHCPFCTLQADAPALPPSPATGPDATLRSHAVPALHLHAPRPLFAWAAAPARAPPSFA